MKDYSAMSDFEVNSEVHNHAECGGRYSLEMLGDGRIAWNDGCHIIYTDKIPYGEPLKDYCNSWADAGPIIQSSKISIIHDCMAEPQDGGCWLARPTYGYEKEKARNDNPLRAAMIVFLMTKGGESNV